MEKESLRVWFDPEGDSLEVGLGSSKKGVFKRLGDDVVVEVDEKGNMLGFAILRSQKGCGKQEKSNCLSKQPFPESMKQSRRLFINPSQMQYLLHLMMRRAGFPPMNP